MKFRIALFAAAMAAAVSAQAAPLDLTGLDYFTYGNANSYALPVDKVYVQSSPGQIKDLVVIYTGAGGVNADVTTNVAGFDDAYQTPNGSQTSYASVGENTGIVNPGNKAGIANNSASTWDASLAALKTLLNGGDSLFMFNNNDTNKDPELAAWARIWITDPNGDLYGRSLYLSNERCSYGLIPYGPGTPVCTVDPNTFKVNEKAGMGLNGDATLYNGAELAAPTTGFNSTDFVRSGTPVNGIDLNIGANNVAYAISVPLLNSYMAALASDTHLADYTLHLDLRLGCKSTQAWSDVSGQPNNKTNCDTVQIDNGYEQLFLMSTKSDITIPEPGSLALVGLALTGLAGLARRRRTA